MKKLKQMSMAKVMGPFRDSYDPSWVSRPRTDVQADPSSHRPCVLEWRDMSAHRLLFR